jgi:hypothetical protein
MLKAGLYLAVGGALGAALGYFNQCAGGTCPLMCLWWRGAIFGAVAGLAVYFAAIPKPKKGGRPDP